MGAITQKEIQELQEKLLFHSNVYAKKVKKEMKHICALNKKLLKKTKVQLDESQFKSINDNVIPIEITNPYITPLSIESLDDKAKNEYEQLKKILEEIEQCSIYKEIKQIELLLKNS